MAVEYTKLTKENMFDVFLNDKPIEIKGDVAEIIERPLYYRVMIIPFHKLPRDSSLGRFYFVIYIK